MPNRVIRDGVLDSQRYHDVDKPARLAFLELLLCCDDYGLVPLSDVYLKRHTTAFEGMGRQAIDGMLTSLVDVDLVRIYEKDGARFAYIPRFGNTPRAAKPKWPVPPATVGGNEIKDLAEKLRSRRTAHAVQLRANAPETETETETETARASAKSRGASPAPAAPAPKVKKPRGVRVAPADFLIDAGLQRWAREDAPLVDIKAETAIFRGHEFAKARLDWPQTWKNWMLKEQKRLAEAVRRQSRPAGKSFRAQDDEKMRSSLHKLTGGLLGRPSAPEGEIFENMENEHDRIGRN